MERTPSLLLVVLVIAACGGPGRPQAAPDGGPPSAPQAPSSGPLPAPATTPPATPDAPPATPTAEAPKDPTDPALRADLPPLPRFAEQKQVVDHLLAAVHAAPDAAAALQAVTRVRADDAALLARARAFAAHRVAFAAQEGGRLAALADGALDAAQSEDRARWTEPVMSAARALAHEAFARLPAEAAPSPDALPAPPPITEEELQLVADLQARRCRLATAILTDAKSPDHIDQTIDAFQKSDGARVLELRAVEEAALGIHDNEARDGVDVSHFAAGDPGLDHARRVWRACDALVQRLAQAWNPDLPPAKHLFVPAMVKVWLPFEVPH